MSHYYVKPGAYLLNSSTSGSSLESSYHYGSTSFASSNSYSYAPTSYSTHGSSSTAGSPSSTVYPSPTQLSSPGFPILSVEEHKPSVRPARRSSLAAMKSNARNMEKNLGEFLDEGSTGKPSYTVKELCAAAIRGSKRGKLTLGEICDSIGDRFPYYRNSKAATALRKSAKHDLSLDPRFVKFSRGLLEPGRGAYWGLADGHDFGKTAKKQQALDVPAQAKYLATPSTSRRRSSRGVSSSIKMSGQGSFVPRPYVASPQTINPLLDGSLYPPPTLFSRYVAPESSAYDFSGYNL